MRRLAPGPRSKTPNSSRFLVVSFAIVFAFATTMLEVSVASARPAPGRATGSVLPGLSRPAAPSGVAPRRSSTRQLIVKYRTTGRHALTECAERLSREGRRFAPHAADGGAELDEFQHRFGTLAHRALFRRTEDGDFASQSQALRNRLRRARDTRGRLARQRSPRPLPELSHVYRVRAPRGEDAEAVLRGLRGLPQVEWAQLDYEIEPQQIAPLFDDPYLTSAGSWDQPYEDLWGLERIGAPETWLDGLGEGRIVAVVDTGVDTSHPDLAANVWVNPGEDLDGDGIAGPNDRNGIDDDGNGFVDDLVGFDFGDSVDANEDGDFDDPGDVSDADPFDERGHGTHVAGTIAAVADNGLGIVGVAPGVRVMAVKGFPAEGPGLDSVLWRAVLYAAENGAHVINNSWSCSDPCPENPLAVDILRHVEALGAVVVTSAGNASADVALRSPENTDAVLTIGAHGYDDALSSFSNRGWGLDLLAPGGGPSSTPGVRVARRNILSLLTSALLEDEAPFVVGGAYRRLAGTSMSAPHVAGAVALAGARRPDLGPAALREWLRLGVRDLGAPGHDWLHGAGALHLPTLFAADPPEVDLALDAPASGSLVDPSAGRVRFDVVATGGDVAAIAADLATGLVGREFARLESLPGVERVPPSVRGDADLAVEWDATRVAPGPRTLRIRVALDDGREITRVRVFGLERIHPADYTRARLDVEAPATDGRRVAWLMEREDEDGGIGVSVEPLRSSVSPKAAVPSRKRRAGRAGWIGPRPEQEEMPASTSIEVEGRPVEVDIDGRLMAWRSRTDDVFSIGWCALERGARIGKRGVAGLRAAKREECRPRVVKASGQDLSRPRVARGWIVWQVGSGAGGTIEGCRPRRGARACDPIPLVAFRDGDPPWRLSSFDGRTLLLGASGKLARCVLRHDGSACTPEEITVSPAWVSPDAPAHGGATLAFGVPGIEFLPPAGCVFGDVLPECAPVLQVVTRLYACRLQETDDDPGPRCEARPITSALRVDQLTGPRVSGRRIVWAAGDAIEAPAVTFCEFEARTGTCPPQRVTGAIAPQVEPDVSGRTLVWRGARESGESVWSLSLPDLHAPARVVPIRPGPFAVPLRAIAGDAGNLSYEVAILEADPSSDLVSQVEVVDPGRPGGRVWLVGRGAKAGEGTARIEIVARDDWGLESRRVVDLRLRP